MARLLIVGGGCRGRRLAAELADTHAVRIVTRSPQARAEIERAGAECFIGDPDRLGTLRSALEGVTLACWLLATAAGSPQQVRALHDERLRAFLAHTVDSTVRGFVYEAGGSEMGGGEMGESGVRRREVEEGAAEGSVVAADALAAGARIVRELTTRNAIPAAILTADPSDADAWLTQACAEIAGLLA